MKQKWILHDTDKTYPKLRCSKCGHTVSWDYVSGDGPAPCPGCGEPRGYVRRPARAIDSTQEEPEE